MTNGGTTRRPAVPPAVRIRRNVSNLGDNHPIITFYERGIEVMQRGNRLDLPTSWRYQAAIHDYPFFTGTDPKKSLPDRRRDPADPNTFDRDPSATDTDIIPSEAERKKFWMQCQHHCWFFLPWHRAYLHFFEKILMKIIATELKGPTDWALPYWNYTGGKMPKAFTDSTIPDVVNPGKDKKNHLRVEERFGPANSGAAFLSGAQTNLNCLTTDIFADDVDASFGGAKLDHHSFRGGGLEGTLEQVPHDRVHGAIGQSGGFMNGFSTAPLDPIFWLHHCNIDRIWEMWVQRQKQRQKKRTELKRNPNPDLEKDPTKKAADDVWINGRRTVEPPNSGVVFDFHDENGTPVTMLPKDLLNTRAAPLSYEYEDTSDPFKGAP